MGRTSRALVWVALSVALVSGACGSLQASLPVPVSTAPPATIGAASQPPPATGDGGTFAVPAIQGQTVQLETTPDQPEDIPGAQGPEEDELNDGDIPPVPVHDGGSVQGAGTTPASPVLPPAAQGQGSPTDLVTYGEPTTHPKGEREQLAEPSVTAHGDRVLMTWNTQAAVSGDGGKDFDYFKLGSLGSFRTADGGYCCDQLTQYVPAYDLWIWVLQYWPSETAPGNNRIRIAIAKGDAAFDARRFSFWDLTAQMAGYPDGIWFDQPKLGVSDRHAFLSINAFTPRTPTVKPVFQAAVVFRIPLDQLAASTSIAPLAFTTASQRNPFGTPLPSVRPAQVTKGTMYLGTHYDTATLGVWSWPDDRQSPSFHRVLDVDAAGSALHYPIPFEVKDGKNVSVPFSCRRSGAADPAASDWCNRGDSRVISAWLGPQGLGFAWNVGQDPSRDWAYPSVWVELIDPAKIDACDSGQCVLGNPIIRNAGFAFQYGTIAPDARGDLGGVVLYGGGNENLSCAVIVHDANTAAAHYWDVGSIATSDMDPPKPISGDYLGVSVDGRSGTSWVAGCMTLRRAMSSPTAVHFVRFGRRVDEPTT
jgi:hypothetical protein